MKHACQTCGTRFENKSMLVQHCLLTNHHYSTDPPVQCRPPRRRRGFFIPLLALGMVALLVGLHHSPDLSALGDAAYRVKAVVARW